MIPCIWIYNKYFGAWKSLLCEKISFKTKNHPNIRYIKSQKRSNCWFDRCLSSKADSSIFQPSDIWRTISGICIACKGNVCEFAKPKLPPDWQTAMSMSTAQVLIEQPDQNERIVLIFTFWNYKTRNQSQLCPYPQFSPVINAPE